MSASRASGAPVVIDADQYDGFAAAYVATVSSSPGNWDVERPAMLSLLGDVEGRTILDAGCGSGALTALLVDDGAEVVGVDASAAMLNLAAQQLGPRVPLLRADLTRSLPLADDAVDLVAMSFVLHYLEDLEQLFTELGRVLRPGGAVVASTHHPLRDVLLSPDTAYLRTELVAETWLLAGQEQVVRFYRRPLTVLIESAREAGFILERLLEPPATAGDVQPRLLVVRLGLPNASAEPIT